MPHALPTYMMSFSDVTLKVYFLSSSAYCTCLAFSNNFWAGACPFHVLDLTIHYPRGPPPLYGSCNGVEFVLFFLVLGRSDGHNIAIIITPLCDECDFFLILYCYVGLVVSRTPIHK